MGVELGGIDDAQLESTELADAEPGGESVGLDSPTCADAPPPAIGNSGSTFLTLFATSLTQGLQNRAAYAVEQRSNRLFFFPSAVKTSLPYPL